MKTIPHLCFLILLATSAFLSAQEAPSPLYTVDLSKLISQELDINPTGTLTFLTEHTLAVSMCRNLRCNLETLDLEEGGPRTIAKTDEVQPYSALFRGPEGRVIVAHGQIGTGRGAILFDSDLRAPQLIPKATGIGQSYISTTGATFAKQGRNDWVVYKMGRSPQRIHAGTGLVLSVSDEAVAYLDQGIVRIDAMDGKPLGSFAVTPRALPIGPTAITPSVVPMIRFLGHDYLLYETLSLTEILDFNGKLIQTLDRPDGWGVRIGQSSDGSRLLYDRYTRHIPLTQKIEEEAIAAATMGMGVGDEKPNGEMVRVINIRSGKRCFEWNNRTTFWGQFHADIDPSGRLIAIMTPTTLNIYSLPEACVAN